MSERQDIPELDPDPNRETPNEWTNVERPLLRQLMAMGCAHLAKLRLQKQGLMQDLLTGLVQAPEGLVERFRKGERNAVSGATQT